MMAKLLVVTEQERRPARLRQDHIQIAVAVDIGIGRASADNGLKKVAAAFVRSDGEKPKATRIPAIPKKLSGLAVLLAGFDLANLGFKMAIGSEHVQPAVQIIIEEKEAELQEFLAGRTEVLLDGLIGKDQGVALGDVQGV